MKQVCQKLILLPLCFVALLQVVTAQNLVKNGSFDGTPSYRGWELISVNPAVTSQLTGGLPGGYIWLNGTNNSAARQKLEGLQPWAEYIVEGDFRGGDSVVSKFNFPGREFFAVDIDCRTIGTYALPNPVTTWGKFSATFMATSSTHVLQLRGKINGTNADLALDNISVRLNNTEAQPRLLAAGTEGKRMDFEITGSCSINLEVLFVDFSDQPVATTNFDELWKSITSNGELLKAFQRHGTAVNVNLNKSWKRMPQPLNYYFPTNTDDQNWRWQDYTSHSINLLGTGADFPPNTIVVIVPNKGATGFKRVGSGAHGGGYRGVRKMITLMPLVYNEHYTTLMHEIGHCFGSGELYPASDPFWHEVGGYDVMGDMIYATGFMGWHRLRYGWLPKSRTQYLGVKGHYEIDLKKLSASSGKAMVVVPDPANSSKLWVIEIGQDVVSRDQFKANGMKKLNAEGDRIIVYTVEDPVVSGKRAIRLVPRTAFSADHGTIQWLDDVSYKETAGFKDFNNVGAPFSFTVLSKSKDGFGLSITVK